MEEATRRWTISGLRRARAVIPGWDDPGKENSPRLFKVAFARLADVSFDLMERVVEEGDVDTLALLCRGADFDRALFVNLAMTLSKSGGAREASDRFSRLYESVPVEVAQRALRFWKIRKAA